MPGSEHVRNSGPHGAPVKLRARSAVTHQSCRNDHQADPVAGSRPGARSPGKQVVPRRSSCPSRQGVRSVAHGVAGGGLGTVR